MALFKEEEGVVKKGPCIRISEPEPFTIETNEYGLLQYVDCAFIFCNACWIYSYDTGVYETPENIRKEDPILNERIRQRLTEEAEDEDRKHADS